MTSMDWSILHQIRQILGVERLAEGGRESINEAYFCVFLKACISEIQARYFNGFNAYSKRKFHMDVKFILKKVAEKHLESMCK